MYWGSPVTLAIFDLDGTLLSGDSDYNWGQFLVEEGIVDADTYKTANDKFYQDYLSGGLDIHEYLAFSKIGIPDFPTKNQQPTLARSS